MPKAIVTLSTNTALVLTPVELGVYVKGKALLASARKAFCLADLGSEKKPLRVALSSLLDMGLVVHRGGGWYALARVPARAGEIPSRRRLDKDMAAAVAAKSRAAPRTMAATLRDALREAVQASFGFDLPAATYSAKSKADNARYRRIVKVIGATGSTPEEFVRFVIWQDWSWTHEGYPRFGIICSNEFLAKFTWYMEHGSELEQAKKMLELYDQMFHFTGAHKYEEHLFTLQIQTALAKSDILFDQFLSYAATRRWRGFDGIPTVKFLSSSTFINQCCSVLRSRGVLASTATSTYFARVLQRLESFSPPPFGSEIFEDYNWSVGEAVFEPLVSFTNDSCPQLTSLVRQVLDHKDSPTLGFYLIAYDGKLTPLAVYWIVFAHQHLGDAFYSGSGDWKDLLRSLATSAVNLEVLEAAL